MARILVVHGERGPRKFLVSRAEVHHEVIGVDNLARAMKTVSTFRPALMIAGLDGKKGEAFDLLRYLKRNAIDLPVILSGKAGAGAL